jgi:hypothetical protein
MNLYVVLSEELSRSVPGWEREDFSPREDYRIYELVVARNRSQARWLAWQADENNLGPDPRAMPKFSVRITGHNVPGPARVASAEYNGAENELMWIPLKERDEYLREVAQIEQDEQLGLYDENDDLALEPVA